MQAVMMSKACFDSGSEPLSAGTSLLLLSRKCYDIFLALRFMLSS